MFEKIGDRWEDLFEDLPGFSLAVAIVVLILAWWSPEAGEGAQHEINALIAVAVAYLLYRGGSIWDDVFDWFYGDLKDGPRWPGGKRLHDARKHAAEKLNCPRTGLYAKANEILKRTEQWKREVKSKMDGSKAARCFIIPLFVLLLVEGFDWKGLEARVVNLIQPLYQQLLPGGLQPLAAGLIHPLLPYLPDCMGLPGAETLLKAGLAGSVVVYLLSDNKKLERICFALAVVLLGMLLLRLVGDQPSSWCFISQKWRLIFVGAPLLLAICLYVWQRLLAMVSLYHLAAELPVSREFVEVEDAAHYTKKEKGLLFAGKAVMPLRVVELYCCKEDKEDKELRKELLQRAELLLSSWAPMDVQVYMQDPTGDAPDKKKATLPVSLLYDEDYMKIVDERPTEVDERLTEKVKVGWGIKPDVLIRVDMSGADKSMRDAAKAVEDAKKEVEAATNEPQSKQKEAKDNLKKAKDNLKDLQKGWKKQVKKKEGQKALQDLLNPSASS